MNDRPLRPEQYVHEYVTSIEICKDERRFQVFYYAKIEVCGETYMQTEGKEDKRIIYQSPRKLELTLNNPGLNKSIGKIGRHLTMLGIDALDLSTVRLKPYEESKPEIKQ